MSRRVAESKTQRQLLNVGCGMSGVNRLPLYFRNTDWHEIRLDIDSSVIPDIVGSSTDLSAIPNSCIDAIWSSHNLEHLHSFEVPVALAEFKRVLRDDGFALITLPDLRAVARYIVNDRLCEPMYHSAAGPIAPLDVLFGLQSSVQQGNEYMAHRTGFTATSLGRCLLTAGFTEIRVHEGQRWDLWAVATMPATCSSIFRELDSVFA